MLFSFAGFTGDPSLLDIFFFFRRGFAIGFCTRSNPRVDQLVVVVRSAEQAEQGWAAVAQLAGFDGCRDEALLGCWSEEHESASGWCGRWVCLFLRVPPFQWF